MKGRLLAAALGVLGLAALLVRGTGRGAAWAPSPAPPPPRVTSPSPSLLAPPPVRRAPSRNLFQYGDERTAAVPPASMVLPRPPRPLDEPPAPEVTPPAAVRVVGLIRRGGHLAAALMVQGEMMVARKGEQAGGYTVLDVDDEAGVRLRAPDGEEMLLPPPSF